VFHNNYALVTI